LRARFCIERGRAWQAEYWIGETRNLALSLACRRRGLPGTEGRGYDELPVKVLEAFRGAFPASLETDELLRALGVVIDCLLTESGAAGNPLRKMAPQLRKLSEKLTR
jgi:hypothetical protein